MQGIRLCMNTLAGKLIDKNVQMKSPETAEGRLVNIINETGVSNNNEVNAVIVRNLLEGLGVKVNCRFLGDATAAQMKNFLAAPLNLMASDGEDTRVLRRKLEQEYGCHFLDRPLPVGFQETKRWLTDIAEYFHCTELLPGIIREEEKRYLEEAKALRPVLESRKLLVTTINVGIDWLLETVTEVGMEVVAIDVFNYLHTPLHVSENEMFSPLTSEISDPGIVQEQIARLKPDLVLSNYTSFSQNEGYLSDSLFMNQTVGFQSAIAVVKRWAEMFKKASFSRAENGCGQEQVSAGLAENGRGQEQASAGLAENGRGRENELDGLAGNGCGQENAPANQAERGWEDDRKFFERYFG